MTTAYANIAFTPLVREQQKLHGSARSYDRLLEGEVPVAEVFTSREAAFIEARDGFYQASISQSGWPYIQFRGGPAGFLKVLDPNTIAYADLSGNRQYISLGNLHGNDRISLILMDYPNRQRLKIFGRAKVIDIEQDPALLTQLTAAGSKGRPERAVLITVDGFDWNCPQHIPRRFTVQEFETELRPIYEEHSILRDENDALRAQLEALGKRCDSQ